MRLQLHSRPPRRGPHPVLWALLISVGMWAAILYGIECFRADPIPTPVVHAPEPEAAKPPTPSFNPLQQVYLTDTGAGYGSAVPICSWQDMTVFLTAKHVAEDPPLRIWRQAEQKFYDVVRTVLDPDLDVALMFVQIQVPIVDIDPEPTQFGETVRASAWTLNTQVLTEGLVSDWETCSASVYPGCSGGGVFRGNRLVGVIRGVGMDWRRNVRVPFISVFTPISKALPWIRDNLPR